SSSRRSASSTCSCTMPRDACCHRRASPARKAGISTSDPTEEPLRRSSPFRASSLRGAEEKPPRAELPGWAPGRWHPCSLAAIDEGVYFPARGSVPRAGSTANAGSQEAPRTTRSQEGGNSQMDFALFTLDPAFRWLHILAGIVWIGHLYFFNFVNGPFSVKITADTKKL